MKVVKLPTVLIILLACLTLSKPLHAQIPTISNVDNLTTEQVYQIIQRAQAAGLSDSQIIQQAKNKGLSDAQAAKLQSKISDYRKSQVNNTTGFDNQARQVSNDTTVVAPNTNTAETQVGLKIFGSDLFRNNNITAQPNLRIATPLNYVLGPDDQLNINVYGNSLVNWKLAVSPEGNINIPGVGILNVAGKTIEQATASIKSKLAANNYAIGRGTSVQVTLGDIRSIKVIVVGEVVKPNTYTLPSLATVFNALYASGGPNDKGSFRQIEIIRNSRIIRRLDVYNFLVSGDQRDNIGLQDQDIIRVPTYRTRVALAGEVKIPALFEVLPGETLQNVINFAGGFTDEAYTARIKVSQIINQERHLSDVLEEDYKSYIPLRGDRYLVDRILDRIANRVTINGAILRPGDFELQKGLTLSQLIKNAGGLKEDAFTGRGVITRLKPDNTTEIIPFDVAGIINKTTPDIPLKREDIITISSIFDLRDTYTITIAGEVRQPGTFLYSENMSVQDLILKAGGFSEGASTMHIEVARRTYNSNPQIKDTPTAQVFNVDIDKNLSLTDAKFILQPFDIVSVYTLPGFEPQKMVKIEGEVMYPGNYTIKKKNEKISDIVDRAGGLTASADVEGGTLKRNNIAILGVDKNRIVDTTGLAEERTNRLARLQQLSNNTVQVSGTTQMRNDYVGIDLGQILENPGTNKDLILEDGDLIRVPKQQQVVRVNGEVLYPSAVVYERGKTFSSYVSNAGGYSPKSLRRAAYVVYPNGTVKATHKILFFNNHPKVKAGSEIYVPVKPERRRLSAGEYIGLGTSLASIAAIVFGIISLHK